MFFVLVEYLDLDKKIKYYYKILYIMRRICGGDGFGVRRAKRSAFFLPKSQMKDPESIAGKIMLEYNSKAVSYVHMQISAP